MTRRASIGELCAPYKREGDTIGLAIVADDTAAKKLIAVFSLAPLPEWRKPASRMPADDRERWLWLWAGFAGGPHTPEFLDGLAAMARIPPQTAYNLWPAIMISRLVFPDGDLSEQARAILRAFVASNLPRPTKHTAPASPPPRKE